MKLIPNDFSKSLSRSRKRMFSAYCETRLNSAINTASYWSGGSRSVFTVFNMQTHETKIPPSGQFPNFNGEYILQPNEILIEMGTFCGKPATPSFTYRAADEANFIKLFGQPF